MDEQRIQMLMKTLKISREEAIELEQYDDDVNKNKKTAYDLTPEQVRNVQEMNRKVEHRKYGSGKLEVNDAVSFCSNVEITNKNRMIHFKVGEKEFDLQLIEKRASKK